MLKGGIMNPKNSKEYIEELKREQEELKQLEEEY